MLGIGYGIILDTTEYQELLKILEGEEDKEILNIMEDNLRPFDSELVDSDAFLGDITYCSARDYGTYLDIDDIPRELSNIAEKGINYIEKKLNKDFYYGLYYINMI